VDTFKISLIHPNELDFELVRVWADLQAANPDLASPYFHPEFTRAVGSVRKAAKIGIVEVEGKIAGFFPFERTHRQIGVPIGGIISDYHGLISAPSVQVSSGGLLKHCGLSSWHFDPLPVSQLSFSRFQSSVEQSPQIDLRLGYEKYIEQRRQAGSEQIKKLGNLIRRIERELGLLRFVAESTDVVAFSTVLGWKSDQYRQTGKDDLFAHGTIRSILERILFAKVDGFWGMQSLLYAGDRLVAGHFGMRSKEVWHYWFPSYDKAAAKYSPGLILLLKMAEHAGKIGVRTIDLGKGMSPYKQRLMNASVPLGSGTVETVWRSLWRRGWAATRAKIRTCASVLPGGFSTSRSYEERIAQSE
jgi:CelD/BcsL family acetyltransferase involved in cellulose biosynthesis